MKDLNYHIYEGLYFSQDMPLRSNITTLDLAISFFLGVLLITALTLILEQWRKEQFKEMEKEMRLLELRLLKMGVVMKVTPT
jgi:hypothetical protein